MIWLWVVIALVIIYIIFVYNNLIIRRNRVKNAWSQIDVQLKRRADLIPNLVETVKGYMKHEREVLENITKARAVLQTAQTVKDKAKANNAIAGALKTLFAVAENYPNLKANQNFMQLQEELSGTESKIAYARQFYNDSVLDYNNSIKVFPKNIMASLFHFKSEEFFKAEEGERKVVKVKF